MDEHYHKDQSNSSPIPEELRKLHQWVIWRYETREGDDKPTKVPYQAARPRSKASSKAPATWSTFGTAWSASHEDGVAGIGFVFTEGDPYVGVDFDDCIDDEGALDPWVYGWLRQLGGYQEVSPSGRGVKVIVRGSLDGRGGKRVIDGHEVEMYQTGRYFTLTGQSFGVVDILEDSEEVLTELWRLVRPKRRTGAGPRAQTTTSVDVDGPPIPDGSRHLTLNSICGRLHDGSRDLQELFRDLMAVNVARCQPGPVGEDEVWEIACWTHEREPCSPGGTPPEVHQRLAYLQEAADRRPVKGVAGGTGWSVYNAMLDAARKWGRVHPRGVVFRSGYRALALAAGVGSTTTVGNFIDRTPLVEVLEKGKGKSASTLLLVMPSEHSKGARTVHNNGSKSSGDTPEGASEQFRHLFRTLYRMRWSTRNARDRRGVVPGTRHVRQYAIGGREGHRRIGKVDAWVIAATMEHGTLKRSRMAVMLGKSPNALSKSLRRLTEAGLMVRVGHGLYRASEDLQSRLEDARELGQEPEAYRLQMTRYALQREAYKRYLAGEDTTQETSGTEAGRENVRRSRENRERGMAMERERKAQAESKPLVDKAKDFITQKLHQLGRIRTEMLVDIWRSEGGDAYSLRLAAKELGVVFEQLPEFDNRWFVFPPPEPDEVVTHHDGLADEGDELHLYDVDEEGEQAV